jgi:hypothetical protein
LGIAVERLHSDLIEKLAQTPKPEQTNTGTETPFGEYFIDTGRSVACQDCSSEMAPTNVTQGDNKRRSIEAYETEKFLMLRCRFENK